jgi:hypothetical protein
MRAVTALQIGAAPARPNGFPTELLIPDRTKNSRAVAGREAGHCVRALT